MSSSIRLVSLGLVFLATAAPLRAESVRDVGWEALLPDAATDLRRETQDRQVKLRALSREQQSAVRRIAREMQIRRLLAQGVASEDRLRPSQRRILQEGPSAKYPEAAAHWARTDELRRQLGTLKGDTNDALDGQRIRLSGYLLPLEVEAGDLILFPSYMLHAVPRNEGGQRISVALNAIPDHLDSWGYTIQFS